MYIKIINKKKTGNDKLLINIDSFGKNSLK